MFIWPVILALLVSALVVGFFIFTILRGVWHSIPAIAQTLGKTARFIREYPSVLSIIAVNLIPLIGIIWFDWKPFSVLFTYWIQTGIIGYFSFLKLKRVVPYSAPERRLKIIPFAIRKAKRAVPTAKLVRDFVGIYIYGMVFSLLVLIFLTGFIEGKNLPWGIVTRSILAFFSSIHESYGPIVLGSLSFLTHHWGSYAFNFLAKKEYLQVDFADQLSIPIERVGGIWAAVFMSGVFLIIPHLVVAVIWLVFFKTMLDVYAHAKEHSGVAKHELNSAGGIEVMRNNNV